MSKSKLHQPFDRVVCFDLFAEETQVVANLCLFEKR